MPFSHGKDDRAIAAEVARAVSALGVRVLGREQDLPTDATMHNCAVLLTDRAALLASGAAEVPEPWAGVLILPVHKRGQAPVHFCKLLPRNREDMDYGSAAAAWCRAIGRMQARAVAGGGDVSLPPCWKCCKALRWADDFEHCHHCAAVQCSRCLQRSELADGAAVQCGQCRKWMLAGDNWGTPWDTPRPAAAAPAATHAAASGGAASPYDDAGYLRPQCTRGPLAAAHPVDVLVDTVLRQLDGYVLVVPTLQGELDDENFVELQRPAGTQHYTIGGLEQARARLRSMYRQAGALRAGGDGYLRVLTVRTTSRIHPTSNKAVVEVSMFGICAGGGSGGAAAGAGRLMQLAPDAWRDGYSPWLVGNMHDYAHVTKVRWCHLGATCGLRTGSSRTRPAPDFASRLHLRPYVSASPVRPPQVAYMRPFEFPPQPGLEQLLRDVELQLPGCAKVVCALRLARAGGGGGGGGGGGARGARGQRRRGGGAPRQRPPAEMLLSFDVDERGTVTTMRPPLLRAAMHRALHAAAAPDGSSVVYVWVRGFAEPPACGGAAHWSGGGGRRRRESRPPTPGCPTCGKDFVGMLLYRVEGLDGAACTLLGADESQRVYDEEGGAWWGMP